MATSLTFTSTAGSYTFSGCDLPVIARRIAGQRQNAAAQLAYRQIEMTFSGFFTGNSHTDLMTKYQALATALKASDMRLTYNDGTNAILSSQAVYIDSLDEPSDWKQYSGQYSFTLHYFEEVTLSYLALAASFVSTVGTFTFSPAPVWSAKTLLGPEDSTSNPYTPFGVEIATEVHVTLDGELFGSSHAALVAKMNSLAAIFTKPGTLNYGSFTNAVRIVSPPSFGPTYPNHFCTYSLTVGYFTTGVYKYKSSKSFTRVHWHPEIKIRKLCPTDVVRLYKESGQTITYNFSLKAADITTARAFLANEAYNSIIPGGVEVEGGMEDWQESTNTINVTAIKYYLTPVLSNVED